eukprot:scaffold41801_cov61-Phaeocystis_antarctica.AAC.2
MHRTAPPQWPTPPLRGGPSGTSIDPALGNRFRAVPSERYPNTVRPVFPVAALAERTVCCCWSRSLL